MPTPSALPLAALIAACALPASAFAQCERLIPSAPLAGPNGDVFCSILFDFDGPGPRPAELIVGGEFSSAGAATCTNLAAWDGTSWRGLAGGTTALSGPVYALAVHNGTLYVGGSFDAVGSTLASGLAYFTGDQLTPALRSGTSFTPNRTNAGVRTLASWGGNLYVGGTVFPFIATWNGSFAPANSNWSGECHVLKPYLTNLIAGGGTPAGAATPRRLMRMNPAANVWIDINGASSSGPSPYRALESFGGRLYVHNPFNDDFLTSWDGTAGLVRRGTPLRTNGYPNAVRAMTIHQGRLIIGGSFAADPDASNLASWDGTTIRPIAGRGDTDVSSLLSAPDALYITRGIDEYVMSSPFTPSFRDSTFGVSKYANGVTSPLGGTLGAGIYSFTTLNGQTIAAGGGAVAADGTVYRLLRWSGDRWEPYLNLPPGTSAPTLVTTFNGALHVVCAARVGNLPGRIVLRRDGNAWTQLGTGFTRSNFTGSPTINSLIEHNGLLYAAGGFTDVGGVAAPGVARWDGASWRALGAGIQVAPTNFAVHQLVSFGQDLIAAGWFDTADNAPAPTVAAWNGTSWRAMGVGLTRSTSVPVQGAAVFNNQLYLSGLFTSVNGVGNRALVRWDGAAWSAPDYPRNADSQGQALAVRENTLFVTFRATSAPDAVRLFSFDGSAFVPITGGFSGTTSPQNGTGLPTTINAPYILALAPVGNELFIGGTFTHLTQLPATVGSGAFARLASAGPVFLDQPDDAAALAGQTVSFTAAAEGDAPLTWYFDGVALADGPRPDGSVISGQGTAALTISNLQPGNAGPYAAQATTPCGTGQSRVARLSVSPGCDPDINGDGSPDQDDVAALVSILAGGPNPSGRDPDFNRDGNADQADAAALIGVLAGSTCP